MELERKPDLDRVLERFEAWWHGEILDRPPVTIHVTPERPPRLPEKQHACLRDRWMDIEYHVACAEARAEVGVYLAETFPCYGPGMGPELTATVFGCELRFAPDTTYSIPIAGSCREILTMQPEGVWFCPGGEHQRAEAEAFIEWVTGWTANKP